MNGVTRKSLWIRLEYELWNRLVKNAPEELEIRGNLYPTSYLSPVPLTHGNFIGEPTTVGVCLNIYRHPKL